MREGQGGAERSVPFVSHRVDTHLLEPLRNLQARTTIGCGVQTGAPLRVEGSIVSQYLG